MHLGYFPLTCGSFQQQGRKRTGYVLAITTAQVGGLCLLFEDAPSLRKEKNPALCVNGLLKW